jgi:hypothetical protein
VIKRRPKRVMALGARERGRRRARESATGPRRSLYRAELSLPRYCVVRSATGRKRWKLEGNLSSWEGEEERERNNATHCVRTESALLLV